MARIRNSSGPGSLRNRLTTAGVSVGVRWRRRGRGSSRQGPGGNVRTMGSDGTADLLRFLVVATGVSLFEKQRRISGRSGQRYRREACAPGVRQATEARGESRSGRMRSAMLEAVRHRVCRLSHCFRVSEEAVRLRNCKDSWNSWR